MRTARIGYQTFIDVREHRLCTKATKVLHLIILQQSPSHDQHFLEPYSSLAPTPPLPSPPPSSSTNGPKISFCQAFGPPEAMVCSTFTLSSPIPILQRAVVFQRIEPARDHDRRAIQHSVVQLTLGYITE